MRRLACHICGSDDCTQMHPERWGNYAQASVSISWDAAIGAIEDIAKSAKKGSFAPYDVKLLRRVADEIEGKI